MADIIKGKIGMEDMELQTNTNDPETFQRKTSTGGTINLYKMPDIVHGMGRINLAEINVVETNATEINATTINAGEIFIGGSPVAVIPDDVTGFSVVQLQSHLIFTWNAVTDTDVDAYEIREGASWEAGIEIVSRAYGLTFTLFDFTSGNKTYRIKAINRSGVLSINDASYAITVVGTDAATNPAGLTATSTFKYIVLEWTNVSNPNVQYTEIWRSDTNDRTAATMIAQTYDDIYWDLIGTTGTAKFYWIRAKNLNGDYGLWVPSSATAGVTATTVQLSTGDYEDLSITNAKIANLAVDSGKIANLAVDTGKIGLLAVQSAQIDDLTVGTDKVNYYSIARGAQYYNAAAVTFTDTTETEIGTLTVVTYENIDSVWFWASVTFTQYGLNIAKGATPTSVTFRIRRDSTTGVEIAGGASMGIVSVGFTTITDPTPVVIFGSDVPGGSVGNHVYKLTATCSDASNDQNVKVAYRVMMGQAKSR